MTNERYKELIIGIADKHKAACKLPNFNSDKFLKELSDEEKLAIEILHTNNSLNAIINKVMK